MKLTRAIYLIFGLIEVLLLVRFALKALARTLMSRVRSSSTVLREVWSPRSSGWSARRRQ